MPRKVSRRLLAEYVADQLEAGTASKKITRQLAAYLLENGRDKELELVLRDVQSALAARGSVSGTITTAFELDQATKKSLETFTKQKTGAKHVTLDAAVDPTVLGGVKLSLPGKELDATIARMLTTLQTKYRKA
ncbi:MAG TPA: F0F1 ATP synthase subunit delta [Dongiaceae bacterium]|nr:F0F1 ATP synthase subunit delta [Dongiaceae bacterium]